MTTDRNGTQKAAFAPGRARTAETGLGSGRVNSEAV